MSSQAPSTVFVLVPGNSQTPSHYAYIQHLILQAGYAVVTALLPSTGNMAKVSVEEDAEYVRTRMILPVLDNEGKNVITISHSYSSIPTGAAVRGLSKTDRSGSGKSTSVLGQIVIAGLLPRGGDGTSIMQALGGNVPPHIQLDETADLVTCDDPGPPLFHDVRSALGSAAVASTLRQSSLALYKSPLPRASFDEPGYRGRCAYIRTIDDRALPYEAQKTIVQNTGEEWVTRDIGTGHSPQLASPERLFEILTELGKHFEGL